MKKTATRVRAHVLLVLLIALAAALGGSAGLGVPAAAAEPTAVGNCTPGSDWGASQPDVASRVVEPVNEHRASIGLVALSVSGSLTDSAVWKAHHMAYLGYMGRNDPDPPV